MLEEMGLPYDLKMLPFPPRVFAKEYLALNPLGTIPLMIDGETRMTESSGILSLSRHPLWTDAAGCRRRRAGLWRIPELDVFQRCDADLSANAGAPLQPARARGAAQSASGNRLRQMVSGPAAGCRSRDRQGGDARRRSVHRGRYRHRLRAAAGRNPPAGKGFPAECRRLLATTAGPPWLQQGRRRGKTRRRRAEG